jgi:hypothetical protein
VALAVLSSELVGLCLVTTCSGWVRVQLRRVEHNRVWVLHATSSVPS